MNTCLRFNRRPSLAFLIATCEKRDEAEETIDHWTSSTIECKLWDIKVYEISTVKLTTYDAAVMIYCISVAKVQRNVTVCVKVCEVC